MRIGMESIGAVTFLARAIVRKKGSSDNSSHETTNVV